MHDAKIERIRRRHRADRTLTSMAAGRIAAGNASASIGATTSSDTTTVTSSATQTATGSASSATGSVSSSTLPTETAISSGKALEGNGKNTTRSATESAADWRKHPIRAWRARYGRYKQTRFYQTWAKRPKFSYGAYVVIMFVLIEMANMFLLWSVVPQLTYDPTAEDGLVMQVMNGTYHWLANTSGILNFFALGILYLICITVTNRFWIGTAFFGAIAGITAFAGKVKVAMRGEPIIPSDLGFLTGNGGGGENVASFVTDDLRTTINAGVSLVVWFVVICLLLQLVDRRSPFIYCSWRHPIAGPKNIFGLICRILAPVLSIWLMVSYATGLAIPGSRTRELADEVGYVPRLWNVMDDAQQAGATTTFLSLTNVKAMDEEPGYNEQAMKTIAQRYEQAATRINQERASTLTDNTVIMVLSESFSDPNRVPGVHFNTDPMPFIRSLGDVTTAGLMLSPGYGGGTANIEFQQMTGLSMANFSDTMLSPYQQLVPTRPEMYSFNQMWNQACGSTSCSVGFHPFLQGFYLRGANYKKFGFSHLYTLDSDPKITHAGTYHGAVANSDNVTDEEAYKNVVEEVRANTSDNKPAQYIELVTMQNHSPYPDLYGSENEFHAANDSQGVPGNEMGVHSEYAKGVQRTDEATEQFLNDLDAIDKPITVVFYGDHLPGIYTTASQDTKNNLALHETNYFIWSNAASKSHDTKLPEEDTAYTSSNFFMAQTAQQLNSKISPYLALLDELHAEVPAISRASTNMGEWETEAAPTYLNSKGEPIDPKSLSAEAKQLLDDYRMVQYDMTVGENYLWRMGFMDLPKQ
ncbi:phosphoglycerol transferase [Bifidobacterium pseudolongum subsp. globosum]|uniref:Phosphoglycerol transferase n=2 Tax=Bifidobacterium pseudolongum TaxID=1694 RepID=A0A2N3QGX0_9BIFI|nr:phosphoglycerol transferase [Bifidobacterium pseudolongum subsp. globosum]